MKNFKDDFLNYTCPKWNELPEIDLYMDQVVNLLEKKTFVFLEENEKAVTSTMINNYVKLKIITPPNKKKYDRKHVCQLLIIILLKKVFSVSEIALYLNYLDNSKSFEEGYNNFCEQVEYSISMLFGSPDALIQTSSEDKITETVAFAFACKLYATTLLNERKDGKKDETDNKRSN